MARDTKEQIYRLVRGSGDVLVVTKSEPTADGVASMLATAAFLRKIGKRAEAVIAADGLPGSLGFLPGAEEIGRAVGASSGEAASGVKRSADDAARSFGTRHDLIVVVDSHDLESLGRVYEENPAMFFEKPLVNIDHSPSNENFGRVNLVDITASSSAEIVFGLLDGHPGFGFDAEVATQILAGIIGETNSFQKAALNPRAFEISAKLVAMGADQQAIVQNLFRTKPLGQLKLWGRVLARTKIDRELGVVWSEVRETDFLRAGAERGDLAGVADELLASVPSAGIFLIFYEDDGRVRCRIQTAGHTDAARVAGLVGQSGERDLADFDCGRGELDKIGDRIVMRIREARRRKEI